MLFCRKEEEMSEKTKEIEATEVDWGEVVGAYYNDPVAFAEDFLNFYPDDWQAKVMYDVCDYPFTAVKSGQGVGKTGVESAVILWYLCTRANAKIVATAPTKQQLQDVLWAEVSKWLVNTKLERLITWTKTKIYMNGHGERWFAVAKTSNRPENMQGYHEENMIFIVDEASGIDDEVMEAVLGTLSGKNNKLLMMGNPTKVSGIFYDAFHKDRRDYRTHTVDSRNSPRASKENIRRLINRYGEESDVVAVRVKGEFPSGDPTSFITLTEVENAVARELEGYEKRRFDAYKFYTNGVVQNIIDIPTDAEIRIGVDIARHGDDETVLAPRVGLFSLPLQTFGKQDLMATTGQVMLMAKELHEIYNRDVAITLDDTGVGGGVTDRLKEIKAEDGLDWLIVDPVNFAEKGDDNYLGVISMMYGQFKDYIKEIKLPDDNDMIGQLSIRRFDVVSKGRIQIESKKEMKRRGHPSPDRAEAVVMSYYKPPFDAKKFKVAPQMIKVNKK